MTFDCPNTSLKQGDKGSQVTELQQGLQKLGYYLKSGGYTLKVDGDYGKYTVEAVKQFQKATGHDTDGWFGPKTCKSFNEKLGVTTTSSSSSNAAQNKVVTTNATSKTTEVIIDAKTYNYLESWQANCTIEGLHFIISQVDDTNSFKGPEWKRVELMADNSEWYPSHTQPLEYKLTTYIKEPDFQKIKPGLLLLKKKKYCKVVYNLIESGNYNVNIQRSYQKSKMWKIVFTLTEVGV